MKRPLTKVICISGQAGHGKDTVGEIIANDLDTLGKSSVILHYADLLKFICKQCFGWDGHKDEAGRSLLQYVGTDVVRRREENFWVDYIARFLKVFDGEWNYAIIPDCRFPNECQYLKDSGFNVSHVKVIRSNFDTALTKSQQNHISETAMHGVTPDYTIFNSGTIADLVREVDKVTKSIIDTYERKLV